MKVNEYGKVLVILSGPPLHGKNAIAEAIATTSNFVVVDMDAIKEEVFPKTAAPIDNDKRLLRTTRSYALTLEDAKLHLSRDLPVIVPATFSQTSFKAPFTDFLTGSGRRIARRIFRLNVGDKTEIEKRIKHRQETGHPSQILSVEKYEWALKLVEPWPEGFDVIDIDTGSITVEESRDAVMGHLHKFLLTRAHP